MTRVRLTAILLRLATIEFPLRCCRGPRHAARFENRFPFRFVLTPARNVTATLRRLT
jgi:hypothetical protein